MDVDTRFGTQEIDPETLLSFPRGLPGFENLRQFKLFHEEGKATVFWLQSVEDPDIQFAVTDPELLKVRYQITLQDDEVALLKAGDGKDIQVLTILYRAEELDRESDSGIKANILAPLLINTRERVGMQKPLNQVQGFVNIQAE